MKESKLLTGAMLSVVMAAVLVAGGCKGGKGETGSETESAPSYIDLNPTTEVASEPAPNNDDIVYEDDDNELPEGLKESDCYRSELTNMWIPNELKNQRPIAVMVDNEITALDHYGINQADIVYELMNSTENGRVTRLMCLVKDWQNLEQFGSIRSTRPTNIILAGEYNAILVHDGGPFYINDYISKPYCNNLSGGFARFSNGKAMEFTEYVTSNSYTNPNTGNSYTGLIDRIKQAGYSTDYTNNYQGVHFQFNEVTTDLNAHGGDAIAEGGIYLPHPHNKSKLQYNKDTREYEYYEYNMAHVDPLDNNNILSFDNVILQSCGFRIYDPNGYMIYDVVNSGTGYYFTKGKCIGISWKKDSETALTKYYDYETGEELKLNTGKTYISLIPNDVWNDVDWD